MTAITDTHKLYDEKRYSWRQVSDVVSGSVAVKRAAEVYLPMPSGMAAVPNSPSVSSNLYRASEESDYQSQYLPWWHSNPAYRAYLQRARLPDMSANTLRGLVGVATRNPPDYELPGQLAYLEDLATTDGKTMVELYSFCVHDLLKSGRVPLVLDTTGDVLRIIAYSTADLINWKEEIISGMKTLSMATFRVTSDNPDEEKHIRYLLKDGIVAVQKYTDSVQTEEFELTFKGKKLNKLPIVTIGSITNTPDPDIIPLLGITDVALAIYREDADGAQARFLTCNPTLFISGIDAGEVPKVIGSSVVIGLSNPAAKAYYPATDTSALEHIRNHINDLFDEAIQYGSQFLGGTKGAGESGDALRLRQAASGTTLIHCVHQISVGLTTLLNQAEKWLGLTPSVDFIGSTEFAEIAMSSQDLLALVSTWVQGGISQDTMLDNLRDAGIVSDDVTNEQEKAKIENARPAIDMSSTVNGGKNDNSNKSA